MVEATRFEISPDWSASRPLRRFKHRRRRATADSRFGRTVKWFVNATFHSLQGLRYTIAHEPAVRQEVIILAVGVLLAFFVAAGPGWYVAMIGVLLILLATELLNTAIERLSDHVTPEHHIEIGIIKDSSSAAVFCRLLLAGLLRREIRSVEKSCALSHQSQFHGS
jgi:diacylglycerol kinase (ATP)